MGILFIISIFNFQVHGSLPFQKCKAALDAVEFSDVVSEEEIGSYIADIITQMALDVSCVLLVLFFQLNGIFVNKLLFIYFFSWQFLCDV